MSDLIELWDAHTAHEFSTRDTEATLDTMVDDAYVNHIPVLTGGHGKPALRAFYSRDFIPKMPPDTTLTPQNVRHLAKGLQKIYKIVTPTSRS